jgi:F0F1-type ATP synthase membrane subunit b/b'
VVDDPGSVITLTPALQWGFAGFALVLLAVLVWLVKQLIAVLRAANDVIARNSVAMDNAAETSRELKRTSERIYERLLQWSCPYAPE